MAPYQLGAAFPLPRALDTADGDRNTCKAGSRPSASLHPIQTADVLLAADTILRRHLDGVVTRILPGRFGIELVRALRARVGAATLPIVILTSLAHSTILDEARCCGATEVMLLPVNVDEIVTVLHRHLRTQRSA